MEKYRDRARRGFVKMPCSGRTAQKQGLPIVAFSALKFHIWGCKIFQKKYGKKDKKGVDKIGGAW